MLYHGTHDKFDRFDLDFAIEGGFFFTNDIQHAVHFGPSVLEVSLATSNLLEVDGATVPEDHQLEDIEALVFPAKQAGKDGVYIRGFRDAGRVQDTIIVFDPAHIEIIGRYQRIPRVHEQKSRRSAYVTLPEDAASLARWVDRNHHAAYDYTQATRELAVSVVFAAMRRRAEERGMPEPSDNSGGCKFASMFAKAIFGGDMRGNYDHQFNAIDGEIVDLNDDALDVKELILEIGSDKTYLHDHEFFGSADHVESMLSCMPRVGAMVDEFMTRASELGLVPRVEIIDGIPAPELQTEELES